MSLPTTAARRIRATGKPEIRLVQKDAKSKPLMAVYREDGTLVGLVDPDKVQPIASPGDSGDPSNAEVAAQAAQVQQNLAKSRQQAARAAVTKAVAEILHAQRERPPAPAGMVIKKATTLDDQFEDLCKTVGSSRGAMLRGVVSAEAVKLALSGAADSNRAIAITKRAACQLAVDRKWI